MPCPRRDGIRCGPIRRFLLTTNYDPRHVRGHAGHGVADKLEKATVRKSVPTFFLRDRRQHAHASEGMAPVFDLLAIHRVAFNSTSLRNDMEKSICFNDMDTTTKQFA